MNSTPTPQHPQDKEPTQLGIAGDPPSSHCWASLSYEKKKPPANDGAEERSAPSRRRQESSDAGNTTIRMIVSQLGVLFLIAGVVVGIFHFMVNAM